MPCAAKKRPQPDPDAAYVCTQALALHGPAVTLAKGTRLPGSDPAVQAAFWCFVEADAGEHEWPAILAAREGR
jgi:hypothetical protein